MHPRPIDTYTLIAGVVIEIATLVAITVLASLHVLPGEAVLGFLGTFVGARAMRALGQGGGGQGGAGGTSTRSSAPPAPPQLPGQASPTARLRLAEVSTVAALALLLFGWLIPHHAHGEA